jgi:RNA polymerase sigma-70 factor (ECF subfamily)
MSETDEDLIREYIDGSQGALKALGDRYIPILYNFSSRFVGTDNASDIAQDIFIKAWKNIKKFDFSRALFKTWIFTIARNTITDYLRKKKSIVFSALDTEDESFSENLPDDTILPDHALEKLEDKELLDKLLLELPENYRTVLLLYYQEDMTFVEIGKILNKPMNTVKSHHRRALEELRKMIL